VTAREVRAADLVVVGAGVVGLAVAWRAAAAGRSVVVVDPSPGAGSSHVAAGMLAPVTEARAAEAPLTRLGLASVARWPSFAEQVADDAGLPGPTELGLRREGTLQVAFDDDDRRALDELAEVHRILGLDSERLSSRACRQLAPLLSPLVRAGLRVGGDWQVDPRKVVAALTVALVHRNGHLRVSAATALRRRGPDGAVEGVQLADGSTVDAGAVVLANGVGGSLGGMPAELHLPVRPVKGEILRLRTPPDAVPIPLTVRGSVQGTPVYLVPRSDGEVVVGATMQEAGTDTAVRAGAVLDLLRAAIDLLPALGEAALVESCAGLRPATPDNAPLLGPTSVAGLHVALGHFRNGVLLAPETAEAVVDALDRGSLAAPYLPFAAGRFG